MELYHIHLLGHQDKMYKENNEINIKENLFNNRLYDRAMNFGVSVSSDDYEFTSRLFNMCYFFGNKLPAGEVLAFLNATDACPEEKVKLLKELEKMLLSIQIAKRELSIENYRKDHYSNKPSRMHSLFACYEEGLDFWKRNINDGSVDIYRIDVLDEPFVTSPNLLPSETSSYLESYNASMRYFNPRQKDLDKMTDEILVQGKVKILEKVEEIRR